MATAAEVAAWMHAEFERADELAQVDAIAGIRARFGAAFVVGRRVRKDVLDAFRRRGAAELVWDGGTHTWRRRTAQDPPHRGRSRGAMLPAPAPPYRPGDRVRCVVGTATRPQWPGRVELRGRVGSVVRVAWHEAQGRAPGYWWVTVDWARGGPYESWPLRAEELEPVDAHWGPGGNPLDRLPS